QPPQRRFRLEIETVVDPSANTQLSGLYRSGAIYCTQCEAEGFRRITYFPDRPDVMAVYTTRIEAEKAEAPVLLANGNLVTSGDVPGFNMGAMENKGLNIFNDKYILASPETATDTDFERIEAVVAHEYFHNWTGNRITCRDWFQLCLKEGLTVFRDQEFSADQRSRAVERIGDVRGLRTYQFVEDAGPLAHPVRPAVYREINNFYTATVYEKGAEVVRMLKGLLGPEN